MDELRGYIHVGFYGAVIKLTFLGNLFCLANSITADVMSASVLLVDHSKTKLYLITNQSSYKILRGISILISAQMRIYV